MKFSKSSQLFLVSSIGLLVAVLLAGCQLVTIDYLYVASSTGIETFAVDSESGALRASGSMVTAGVSNPAALAVTSDYANLYVANQGNNTVVHYTIAINGTLTQKDSVTLGAVPVSLAVNAANTYLYVVSGTTSATLTEYALSSGTIGSAAVEQALTLSGSYASDTILPTGVTVLANNDAVYVTAYDRSAYNPGGTTTCPVIGCANPGWIFGYAVGSGGALTAASGSPWEAGVKPSALVADPTDRFVYVTDYASNQLIGYSILNNNVLQFMLDSPFKTGSEPAAIVVDPRGKFLYVANALSSTVSAYSITLTTGIPTATVNATSSSLSSTDTEPVAVAVDPALGRFVYTANYLGNTISGFKLDPTSGAVTATQSTPYPTSGQKPTALVAIPHGNHATQSVAP